jgi:CheY-like chemotaxis protein
MAMRAVMKKKILLVENDIVLAVLTKLELEEFGYDVLNIAATGEKAIEVVREKNPDLVLMDVKLDGDLDGTEAAKHIQNHFSIPVIFLTGTPEIVQARMAHSCGCLTKPCRTEDLHKAIEQALFQKEFLHRLEEDPSETFAA